MSSTTLKRAKKWLPIGLAIVVGLLLSFALLVIQWFQSEHAKLLFIGLDGMNKYLAICLVTLFIVCFVLLKTKPRASHLAIGGIGCLMIGASAKFLVRVDGYYGNRTPRITWSWTPKAESEFKTYLASSNRSPLPTSFDFAPTEADFSELLGRNRDGKIDACSLDSNWNEHPPVELWRHPVGLGWSSFATVGNAAVTLEQRDELESVVCYDLRTGEEIWCHGEQARFRHEYGDGPRSTPTIRDGRVFSMGGTGILTCIDVSNGQLIWKRSVFSNPATENLIFGMTGSPLVVGNLVVVTPGAGAGAAAIAFSIDSGTEVWRSGDDQASFASPSVAKLCGVSQILSFNGEGLRSYSLNGDSLWLQPWITQGESRVNVAQPIVLESVDDQLDTRVLISSGYDKGTSLVQVTQVDGSWKSELVWESKQLKSKLSNIVIRDKFAYGLDNGILACIDLKDGTRAWKGGRYGHGKILLVQDKLLVQAESGEVAIVDATNLEHRELSRFTALSSKTWNYMTLAGSKLIVRNDREAAAFHLP